MALQKFPGFIDIHVHLRDPGATHKEDFGTGTRAAIKGGFTFVCDMPNNPGYPTISDERVQEKIQLSRRKSLCDVGFHYGTDGKNVHSFSEISHNPNIFGLKLYSGETTGELLVTEDKILDNIISLWNSSKPILLHAEGDILQLILNIGKHYKRHMHVCHVSTIRDLEIVRKAKENYNALTAGVTPHHLYLTQKDLNALSALAFVNPEIGDESTRLALWEALQIDTINLVESDHAPHTKNEKISGAHCFGVPGLETTLGLFCRSVYEKKITFDDVIRWLYENPKIIFNIPDQKDTFVELDPSKPYIVGKAGYESKCGWSPFDGWELFGPVETVVIRNKPVVANGKVI